MCIVELVIKSLSDLVLLSSELGHNTHPLVELSSDRLARQKPPLTDQQLATFIECGTREYDLLSTILEQSTMSLLQEPKQKADKASTQTLKIN